jgi:hypothetical protein
MDRPASASSRPARVVIAALSAVFVACVVRPAIAQSAKPDTAVTGTISGEVSAKELSAPLPYSVVSIPAEGREQFTNDRGAFTLSGVRAGMAHLRIRHLGYAPFDVDVQVHPGEVASVHVQLTHIAVRLDAVQVRAYPECTNPGPPKIGSTADSAFATVFDQLRQNAEQLKLLTKSYPFIYAIERVQSNVYENDRVRVQRVDTVGLRSENDWKYKPGTVLSRTGTRLFGYVTTLKIPTLVHFADEGFLANHCFYNGGVETVDGNELFRIDFVAASRIKDPDVDGAMYLDPTTFQIRRAFLHLSKVPKGLDGVLGTEATTLFAELLPSVPLLSAVSSVTFVERDAKRPNPLKTTNEDQRLIGVEFTKGRPGEPTKPPF